MASTFASARQATASRVMAPGVSTLNVICAGEALWDLAPPGGTSLRFRPGGGAVNAAVALARSGLRVGLVVATPPAGRSWRGSRRPASMSRGLRTLHALLGGLARDRGQFAGGGGLQPQTDMRPGTVVVHWPLQVTRRSCSGHFVCASSLFQMGPTGTSSPWTVPQTDIWPGTVVVH
ncbi:hypothetical protein WME96_43635 [Sorangium sp. So ce406]